MQPADIKHIKNKQQTTTRHIRLKQQNDNTPQRASHQQKATNNCNHQINRQRKIKQHTVDK